MCTGNFIERQRCRGRVINDFLSRYRHLLVPLVFHDVTFLHPLYFREMIHLFHIRASVDALYRDGMGQISRDPRTKRH